MNSLPQQQQYEEGRQYRMDFKPGTESAVLPETTQHTELQQRILDKIQEAISCAKVDHTAFKLGIENEEQVQRWTSDDAAEAILVKNVAQSYIEYQAKKKLDTALEYVRIFLSSLHESAEVRAVCISTLAFNVTPSGIEVYVSVDTSRHGDHELERMRDLDTVYQAGYSVHQASNEQWLQFNLEVEDARWECKEVVGWYVAMKNQDISSRAIKDRTSETGTP